MLFKSFVRSLMPKALRNRFVSSAKYWDERYASGGNSGPGSYKALAQFKASVINELVRVHHIKSVMEFGCGDGNQLRFASYEEYLGIDVSPIAVERCRVLFSHDSSKSFMLLAAHQEEQADLALSLDVIYHLIEDSVFEEHMRKLFGSARKLVIIYSSDTEENIGTSVPHIRHRQFSKWVTSFAPSWELEERIRNVFPFDGDPSRTTFADFFVYRKK